MRNWLFLVCTLLVCTIYAQTSKKELEALRIDEPPTIDGVLNEDVWKEAEVATDFVMLEPGNGEPAPENRKTEVKILYNDNALFIGAYLYDDQPENIMRQISERDNFGTSDVFGLTINPNNDGQNEFAFIVTAGETQLDSQISPQNGDDYSWSEVWFSKVSFDEKGWYVEIKIPFSALRFAKEEAPIWGLNLYRNMESQRELYTWNYIDKSKGMNSQYSGLLKGLRNIDPPTRLSFSPFASMVLDHQEDHTTSDLNFGMDVKYGITDNFTLYATLVPDFSQAGFDNVVLNLGPFEQVFSEQRQFFIEGADLLQKGDLFFSRRIGNQPTGYDDLAEDPGENKEIIYNPDQVKVLNAVKVTGRSKKGLGVGVLNSVTKETFATVRDTLTGEESLVMTEPLANYNVFVIDQTFNNNSSIGIVNTNVLREGNFRDANVSSLVLDLSNKSNSYRISGNGSLSRISEAGENIGGLSSSLSLRKTKGNIRFGMRHRFADDKYDKNDLGFQRNNNYNDFFGDISYRIFKPRGRFNSFNIRLFAGHFRRFEPSVKTGDYMELGFFATTRKQLSYGIEVGSNLTDPVDFFEPRQEGRYWVKNPRFRSNGFLSTDFRKKLAAEVGYRYSKRYHINEYSYSLEFMPRFRFNDRTMISYGLAIDRNYNQRGYVTTLEDDSVIFGIRQNNQLENTLSGKYSFNDRSSVTLSFRHYWSTVAYDDQFYLLTENGSLEPSDYSDEHDRNFNSWNLDLRYVWRFTRGSELVALYRNSITGDNDDAGISFTDNLKDLLEQPNGHLLSIKVIYFLDYNNVKRWLKKGA